MSRLIDTPRDKNLIFDVGLHRGEDTEFYLKKGFRVVAFEANPELVALCTQELRSYIDRGQLIIINGAIVEPGVVKSGQRRVAFYLSEVSSGWGTVRTAWAERSAKAGNSTQVIEVEVVDFVQALRDHGIPHYLKIDIEGCDTVCLQALEAFRERPDYVSIESDRSSFANVRKEVDLLCRLGYDRFQAVEQSGVISQVAVSPAREGQYCAHSFSGDSSGLFGAELPDRWASRAEILRLYRYIRAGYYLLGNDGILNHRFRGAGRLRAITRDILSRRTCAAVPGWYDTHARLSPTSP